MSLRTHNWIVIDAPMDVVWDMTNDVENWPNLFSEYASTEILHRDGPTVRFRLTLHPDENGVSWTWVSERTMDVDNRVVTAHRVETGPFEFMNLRWEFTEVDEGVRMEWIQEFGMLPTAPIDDAGMQQRINRNSRIQMELIRDRVQAAAGRPASGVPARGR